MSAQAVLCRTLWETRNVSFLVWRLNWVMAKSLSDPVAYASGKLKLQSKQRQEKGALENEIDVDNTQELTKLRNEIASQTEFELKQLENKFRDRLPSGGGYYLSLVMRKPDFCLCKNKGADQLHSNCEADQRLCFRYSDSTIPLLLISKIPSFWPSSVAVQPGLCWTWSKLELLVFSHTGLFGVLLLTRVIDVYNAEKLPPMHHLLR